MAEYNQDQGHALDWTDTEVEDTGGDFVVLEGGTYSFMIEGFERKRFEGSAKMSACPKAEIKLIVDGGTQGIVSMTESLFLHSKSQWRVARFFEALGFPKNPETNKVQMNWDAIIGRNGWAEIGPRTYKNDKGEERQTNDVKKFLKPEEWPAPIAAGIAPQVQAAPPVGYSSPAIPAAPQPAIQPTVPPTPPAQQQMPIAAPNPYQGGFQ